MRIEKLKDLSPAEIEKLLYRFGDDFTSVMVDVVAPIVNEVRKDGARAVRKYTEKFDKVALDSLLATEEEIEEGYRNTPENVREAFIAAKNNIEEFHSRQKKVDISYTRDNGSSLGVLYQPLKNAAMYVPGGKASYPSSVLMGVIPAQIAGVENITVVTPPSQDGRLSSDAIYAICKILGITTILKAGGAQGIAAAGWGIESVSKADIIVGPGNVYVTAAKSYLFSLGIVQIDSLAGPSEVLVIADSEANPKWVAWDLLSQAEHEEQAIALLVTTSEALARNVAAEIEKDLASGKGRQAIKQKAIAENGLILLVDSIEEAIEFSNAYAPEHMEFMVREPMPYLARIKNVGSLFLGDYAPVAVGDYYSGTNHILPVGGATRFSSGLSVETFYRRTTYQYLTREALQQAQAPVRVMSKIEGFADKHGGSIDVRFK